jgi:ABC-2 type transport system ATP-binding protein
MKEDPIVVVEGATKWFGAEQVLKGVDLRLERGSVTALLGRNGSGKSTLMRILLGVVARDGGRAAVLGHDPEELPASARRRIAWVTDASTGAGMSMVADEVALHRRLRGDRWDEQRAQALLERFELPPEKRLGALSKGLQTRLRLVLALAADPELLILDEPALGLDLFARHDFLEAIIETEGRAVLIASHLIDDVERVSDRIVFLREGVVRAEGTMDDLRESFRRVRLTLPEDGSAAFDVACSDLIGIERSIADANAPKCERVVVFNDFSPGLLAELEQRSGARRLELRRMSLREIYFEVLAGKPEVTV